MHYPLSQGLTTAKEIYTISKYFFMFWLMKPFPWKQGKWHCRTPKKRNMFGGKSKTQPAALYAYPMKNALICPFFGFFTGLWRRLQKIRLIWTCEAISHNKTPIGTGWLWGCKQQHPPVRSSRWWSCGHYSASDSKRSWSEFQGEVSESSIVACSIWGTSSGCAGAYVKLVDLISSDEMLPLSFVRWGV